jgi:hypothetical protein
MRGVRAGGKVRLDARSLENKSLGQMAVAGATHRRVQLKWRSVSKGSTTLDLFETFAALSGLSTGAHWARTQKIAPASSGGKLKIRGFDFFDNPTVVARDDLAVELRSILLPTSRSRLPVAAATLAIRFPQDRANPETVEKLPSI